MLFPSNPTWLFNNKNFTKFPPNLYFLFFIIFIIKIITLLYMGANGFHFNSCISADTCGWNMKMLNHYTCGRMEMTCHLRYPHFTDALSISSGRWRKNLLSTIHLLRDKKPWGVTCKILQSKCSENGFGFYGASCSASNVKRDVTWAAIWAGKGRLGILTLQENVQISTVIEK